MIASAFLASRRTVLGCAFFFRVVTWQLSAIALMRKPARSQGAWMAREFFPSNERWPLTASLLGGAHAQLILGALNDPVMIVYTGWYVDSLRKGPVWHRWDHQFEKDPFGPRVGIAFLSALYGLACHGLLEFCTDPGAKAPSVRACSVTPKADLLDGTVECEILDHVRVHSGCAIEALLDHVLPKGSLRRGNAEHWLRDHRIRLHGQDPSPERLVAALALAAQFVELEAGLGIEEQRRDRLEELLYEIEIATFRHLE